jgi:hypothetical protein
MISRDVADSLISIISCESETLAKLATNFESSCSKVDQLSVLTSLSGLLMDDVLEQPQQIIAIWLLRSAFPKVPIRENPFYGVFEFIFQSGATSANSFSQKLCDIVSCFLSGVELDDLRDRSVLEILADDYAIDTPNLADLVNISPPPLPRISPVIISKADASESQITQHQLLRELLIDPSIWTGFDVPFSRLTPEISAPSLEELQFMHISSIDAPPFVLDQLSSLNPVESAKFLIAQSAERPLRPWETQHVLAELKGRQGLVKDLNLKKSAIDRIVEVNPQIGAVFMLDLVKSDPKMYAVLEKSDIVASSVEIVKEVVLHAPVPKEFLENYINFSMQNLLKIKDQSLALKTKLFCNMLVVLRQNDVAFSAKALLDLHSLEIELGRKGVAEASLLAGILN